MVIILPQHIHCCDRTCACNAFYRFVFETWDLEPLDAMSSSKLALVTVNRIVLSSISTTRVQVSSNLRLFFVIFNFFWELNAIIKRILFDLMGGSLLVITSTTKKPLNSWILESFLRSKSSPKLMFWRPLSGAVFCSEFEWILDRFRTDFCKILKLKSIDKTVIVPVDIFMLSSINSGVSVHGFLNRNCGVVRRIIMCNRVRGNTCAQKARSSKTL